jgi:hypothetical protein
MSSDTLLTRGDRETHLPQAMAALEAPDRRGKHKARAAVLAAHKAQHSAGAGGGAGGEDSDEEDEEEEEDEDKEEQEEAEGEDGNHPATRRTAAP